jgi:RNA polymerase sigma factor (sigma-70 family)
MSRIPDTPVTLIARMAAQATGEDEATWVKFFEIYQPVIRHFAESAGAKSDADDVVQDVLMKLVDVFRSGTYHPEKGRFRAFLATITRREVINRWQKAQARAADRHVSLNRTTAQEIVVQPEAAAILDAKWRLAQHAAAVEHVLTRTALAQRSKDVYRAYVLEEKPIGEVAKAFGVSRNVVSQVKTRVDAMIADFESMLRD